jgi:hypothetical protein
VAYRKIVVAVVGLGLGITIGFILGAMHFVSLVATGMIAH